MTVDVGGEPEEHTHTWSLSVGDHTHGIGTDTRGGDQYHNNMPPTLITNYVVVGE